MAQGTLTREGEVLHLRSKSFRLLCELARQPGRVVSKSELLDAVWPDVVVTEDSLSQAVRDIRVALQDEAARILRTLPRRGFMLCPTEESRLPAPVVERAGYGEQPRIALLPLANRTGDPELGPVLESFVEEITTGLAKFRNLTVVARHSAFAAAGVHSGLSEIGGQLRADYLVDGSARRSNGDLILTLALIDVATAGILWGESFVCNGTGWLTLQDTILRRIVQRLFTSVEEAAHRASLRQKPEELSAFEAMARGRALFRSYQAGSRQRALEQFARAVEADPMSGLAHSYHALARLAVHRYALAPSEVKREVLSEAMRGVELAPEDARCWGTVSLTHALLGGFKAAEEAARRAVQLNPCDADALFNMAYALLVRGRPLECIDWLDRAKEINPLWPPLYDEVLAYALYDLERYADAAHVFLKLPRLRAWQEMQLAACYAFLDRPELVRRHVSQAQQLGPGVDFLAKLREDNLCEDEAIVTRLVQGVELALNMSEVS